MTAYVSVWSVEYSERGTGTALVLWHQGRVRAIGRDTVLASWLAENFVRHFPEVVGLPWRPEEPENAVVEVAINLTSGGWASGADVELRLDAVLDRRVFTTGSFALGDEHYGLSNVFAPCRIAELTVADAAVPGAPVVGGSPERPTSTAFIATAEVWTRRTSQTDR